MKTRSDILYRLARFLAGIPPDTLGAMVLFAVEHPELIAALFVVVLFLLKYVVGLIISAIVTWYLVKMLAIHAWPKLPRNLQQLLRRIVDRVLLRPPSQDLPTHDGNLKILYSPKCLVDKFCELRVYGVLRTSTR
jgi:hypothetical protein